MKKILITGGLGFIGHHVALQLSQNKNFEIILADHEQYFFDKGRHNYNYYLSIRKQLLNEKGISTIPTDISNFQAVTDLFKANTPDIILHFASLPVAGVADYFPHLAKQHIFDSTYNAIHCASEQHVKQFVYISSSMVYGSFPKDEQGNIIPPAEDFPCNPIDIYGSFKLCGENILKAYHERKKLAYTIIRPSAVYGFTDCNFRVTELFAANALLGKPLLLDNGGQHLLDFTYIDDVVHGLTLTIDNEAAINHTFNISRGESRSIKDLAETLSSIVPATTIELSEAKPFRPNRGAMNVDKAKKMLGYNPQFDLTKGIEVYVEKMKAHIASLNYPEKYY
ncbi:MAG: hypothetical protein CVU05_04460 [Bacteroidetes bacterium HGW-Bacteroidetes-21]|jgi:nucleoside-diphosphate-sugar epimerase|nr:MAG: hypothetical protein CVU05_04460 [Bacteroidetes bacterium HGW-Bacteroidetes-21]